RIGIPTEEVFLSIAMLNALSGELNAVQTQVTSLLSSSMTEHPFTSVDICARLNTERQLFDNEKARSTDLALAAATKFSGRGPSPKVCSLCGKNGHTVEACWQLGGGMAGCREERSSLQPLPPLPPSRLCLPCLGDLPLQSLLVSQMTPPCFSRTSLAVTSMSSTHY
ncbi:hypothetical protein PAXRUDRAFT_169783, partial [Paxillus rubicundulus Ve08.2h10]